MQLTWLEESNPFPLSIPCYALKVRPALLMLVYSDTSVAKSKTTPCFMSSNLREEVLQCCTVCVFFFPSSKETIMERATLITPKEFEACTNSPSPIRLAQSLPFPLPSSPSLLSSHSIIRLSFCLFTLRICSHYLQLGLGVKKKIKSRETKINRATFRLWCHDSEPNVYAC